uniref:thiamine pyrophosphate-binding protein n=1 Tax=Euzebya pacifica TaxID=1608957 RepID=UPI0030FCC19B
MASRRGARLLAEMLDGYGVDHVFFVPTILSHTLLEMEQRTGISRVVTHGEKAAAYMADGYGRVSGRPGVCFGQTVGAANLAAGLRDAYMGCSPMIAFTGGPYTKGPASGRDRNRYQEVNDFPIFGAVTKASTRAENIGDLARSVRQAFRTATTDRPGPVHIELPGHLGEELELVETDEPLLVESQFAAAPPFRSLPDDASIASAADLLATADRPVLILGGGARLSGAGLAAATLAERHGIPVVTSLNAKATIPADHPMNFGVVGAYPRHSTNQLVEEADLALFVGSKTGSQVTRKWTLPRPGTTVIQCDVVAADMGINYPNTVSLLGDARDTLELLTAALATGSSVDR